MALVKREEKKEEIREYRPCAFEPCNKQAELRMRKGTSTVDVCRFHYDKLFHTYANAWCVKRGLDTKQKQMDYCRRIGRAVGVKVAA